MQKMEGWQLHFGTIDNSGNAADHFDADGDGLVNLLEYAFGLNPTSGTSLRLPQPELTGNNFTITFTRVGGVT